jgi:hypothetical protein
MKKFVFMMVLEALVAGGLFAQEKPKNWVYGQVGLIGGGIGYERFFFPSLSIGAEGYFNSFFFLFNSFGGEAYAKFYPFKGKTFYLKLGLGFGVVTGIDDYEYTDPDPVWGGTYTSSEPYSTKGFLIDPALGWKIDVGQPGKFFIEPKLGLAIVMGKQKFSFDWAGDAPEAEFKVGFNPIFAFAMGYAF